MSWTIDREPSQPLEQPITSFAPLTHATSIYISNLTRNVNADHLQEIFENYGEVQSTKIHLHTRSNTPKGTASIDYTHPESVLKALEHMNGGQIDGQIVTVEISHKEHRNHSRDTYGHQRRF